MKRVKINGTILERRRAGLWLQPLLSRPLRVHRNAFTVLELLVVISIMAILAVIAIPVMSGFGKSNAVAAANRQLLDDLSSARARAIAEHTTVYMVFIPPEISGYASLTTDPFLKQQIINLNVGQYTKYALLTRRTVGDQPGRPTSRYLTSWRTLPSGVFIPTQKFQLTRLAGDPIDPFRRDVDFLFPYIGATNATPPTVKLPYIAFDYLGRLVSGPQEVPTSVDEIIPLARGSVLYARDGNKQVVYGQPADAKENPPGNTIYNTSAVFPYYPTNAFNQVRIDALTGRAHVEKQELQ
jgi:prepilin-type N-terminal cleavage/methylation domain-containing protein